MRFIPKMQIYGDKVSYIHEEIILLFECRKVTPHFVYPLPGSIIQRIAREGLLPNKYENVSTSKLSALPKENCRRVTTSTLLQIYNEAIGV